MNDILLLRVFLDDAELEHRVFATDMTVIGRDPYADIYLEDPKVSRVHAIIKRIDRGFTLESVGTNGTLVNGRPSERCALGNGDSLRIGRFRIEVEVHSATSSTFYLMARSQGLTVDVDGTLKEQVAPTSGKM